MRKRPLNNEDALYEKQLNFVGWIPRDEFDVEKELGSLSPSEQRDLNDYFFVGQEIDVEDVFDYRDNLLKNNPNIQNNATLALKRLLDNLGFKAPDVFE